MIDEGELDWKIIAIRTDDPMAEYLNDIDDVERCEFATSPADMSSHPVALICKLLIGV